MKINVYKMNSFAKTEHGGNEAGVVLQADNLSVEQMQKIARAVGFSETAFVTKSDCADFKIRFFTPNEEVDLCGHATIGAFYTLSSKGFIKPGTYSQQTKAGILNVRVNDDFSIMMDQPAPVFYETIDKKQIADSLNINQTEIVGNLPVQIVSTGLKDIIVPVKNLAVLSTINPDFDRIKKISELYNVVGYHVFTLESLNGSTAHCRNFAPLYAIPEESATGTSNGALACYLFKYCLIDNNAARKITFEQGYLMGKPSEILASVMFEGNAILGAKVGGKVLNMSEMVIEI